MKSEEPLNHSSWGLWREKSKKAQVTRWKDRGTIYGAGSPEKWISNIQYHGEWLHGPRYPVDWQTLKLQREVWARCGLEFLDIHSWLLTSIYHGCDEIFGKIHFRKHLFWFMAWGYKPSRWGHASKGGCGGRNMAPGHIVSTVREQREINTATHLAFYFSLFFIHSETLVCRLVPPFRIGHPCPVKHSW